MTQYGQMWTGWSKQQIFLWMAIYWLSITGFCKIACRLSTTMKQQRFMIRGLDARCWWLYSLLQLQVYATEKNDARCLCTVLALGVDSRCWRVMSIMFTTTTVTGQTTMVTTTVTTTVTTMVTTMEKQELFKVFVDLLSRLVDTVNSQLLLFSISADTERWHQQQEQYFTCH